MRSRQEITDILFDAGLIINKDLVEMAYSLECKRAAELYLATPPPPRQPQIIKDEYGVEKEVHPGDIIYKVYPGNQWATAERPILNSNGYLLRGTGGGKKFFNPEDREQWIRDNKPVVPFGKLEKAISFLDSLDIKNVLTQIETP